MEYSLQAALSRSRLKPELQTKGHELQTKAHELQTFINLF